MIIHKLNYFPENILETIIDDSKKEFVPDTSYTLVNGLVGDYFYKKINMPKIRDRFDGNYVNILIEYYKKLNQLIQCNEMVGVIEVNNDIYEISKKINSNKFLNNNINVTFDEIKKLFNKVMDGINKLEKCDDKTIGIDTAIWNYTRDGIFFDYDPPRFLRDNSLFVTSNDDYKKRILYRNFNYIGMRTNALATILLGNTGNNFKISNYSKDYVYELINILLLSINNSDDLKKLKSELFGFDDLNDFSKHPINIIRKELKKK